MLFPIPALLNMLNVVLPRLVSAVRTDRERQVVMGVLETINGVVKSCKEEVFRNPSHLKEISLLIRDVLRKKVGGRAVGFAPPVFKLNIVVKKTK